MVSNVVISTAFALGSSFALLGCDHASPTEPVATWRAAPSPAAPSPEPSPVPGPIDADWSPPCAATCEAFEACVVEHGDIPVCAADNMCPGGTNPCETASMTVKRHSRVAKRRGQRRVMVHRGAWGFAHENTAEAMRATFELGADGNEIDVRTTADGIQVLFHDDMLEALMAGFGVVADYDWDALQGVAFRAPGQFGEFTRIPTLVEIMALHQRHAGLLTFDFKVLDADDETAQLLDALDMWDHVSACGNSNGRCDEIVSDPRFSPLGGLVGLANRLDFDLEHIESIVPGLPPQGGLFVDDPRPALLALGRPIGVPSTSPVRDEQWVVDPPVPATEDELVAILLDDADWNIVPITPEEQAEKATKIRDRAEAALLIARHGFDSDEVKAALHQRIIHRSLHPIWRWHGLDSTEALWTYFEIMGTDGCDPAADLVLDDQFPCAHDLARYWLEHDGADLAPLEPVSPFPPSDWRIKLRSWERLEDFPHEASEAMALDYLALSDEDAAALGLVTHESAIRTLLAVQPLGTTLQDHMDAVFIGSDAIDDERSVVSGRAIWDMLARRDEYWASRALRTRAEWTLALP